MQGIRHLLKVPTFDIIRVHIGNSVTRHGKIARHGAGYHKNHNIQ